MRKKCSTDREKLLNVEAEGREFAKFLRSLEQFFLTVGQNNLGNKIPIVIVVTTYNTTCQKYFRIYLLTVVKPGAKYLCKIEKISEIPNKCKTLLGCALLAMV